MQLFSRNKALAALSLGALVALGACGDDVTVPAPVNPPVSVTISPSNANVNVGASVDLAVAITGGASTPTLASCSTSSAAVATVAVQGGIACRVTGVSTGAVTITATTSGGQAAAASVTVNAPAPAISGIAISPAAQNVQVGGTFNITANPTTTAPGATVARGFVSSNTAVATVSATGTVTAVAPGQATITVTLTGTGTGLSQAVVTGQVAVTVVANPPAVTGVSVTPASAAMVVGAAPVTGTATATAATGITPTFTAGSSNPGVATATVTSAGAFTITAVGAGQAVITITAQSAGNASFAAASATAQIPVTVNAAAQVAIANITSGTTNSPVDISQVSGQIQVALNLTTNNNVVRAVRLFVCPVNGTCPTAPAAEQTFGAAGAANGQINMFINTADFTVASDWSSATTRFANGQQNIVAQLDVANAAANNTLAILNLTNTDGFAARHIAPTRAVVAAGSSTSGANGLTYYGGPGAEGKGSVTIVPVIYTAGRTITSAIADVTGSACPGTNFSFTGAGPWTITYGGTSIAAGDTLNTVSKYEACSGTSGTTPNVGVMVLSAVDNAQNNVAGLPTTSFRTNSSSSPAVTAPAVIRADYQAPSTPVLTYGSQSGSANNWVNATYSFTASSFLTTPATDGGSGIPSTLAMDVQGCPYVSTSTLKVWSRLATNTGADINECVGDNRNNVYEIRYIPVDRLGNIGTTSNLIRFGVDKTAPLIRFSAATGIAADQAINPAAATAFQAEALDERAGLQATASHFLARTRRAGTSTLGLATGAASTCVVGTAASAGFGSLFITAPGCSYATGVAYSGTATDGYSIITPVATSTLTGTGPGYYVYRASVRDDAGNLAQTDRRAVAVTTTFTPVAARSSLAVGTIRADTIIASITAAFSGPFTGQFIDNVETAATGLRMSYGAVVFGYPLQNTSTTLFDNVITRDSVASASTPFMSGVRLYTSVEQTDGSNAVGGTNFPLAASGIFARNIGGDTASAYAAFLTGSITFDNTSWTSKNAVALSPVNTWQIIASGPSFNSPEGGLKAQVVTPQNSSNSPFNRVDFYRQVGTSSTWEYAGSVDGTTVPCTSVAQTCSVYIGENVQAGTRAFTYVLRTGGTGAVSTDAIALNSGVYVAVGVQSTAGRGLLTQPSSTFTPPPVAFRR